MQIQPKLNQALIVVAVLAVVGWLLFSLAPVLAPFILAGLLAYALSPLVDTMARWRVPRWLAAALAIAMVMLVLLALLLLVVPVVTKQIPLIRDQVPALLGQLNAWTQPLLTRWGLNLQIDVAQIRQTLYQVLSTNDTDVLRALLNSLRMGGNSFVAILGNGILMPIVAFYLLLDYPRVVRRAYAMVPRRWLGVTTAFFADVNEVLGHYLRGQLLVMVALIVFYVTGLAMVGLDLAFPIGFFTGFFVFVPYLGFGFGLVIGLLAAALEFQSAWGVLSVLAVFMVGQVIEGFWLTPKLLGERIGLSPIAVIFALMAFAQLFGFVGVLTALPASAVLVVAVRRLRVVYQNSGFYLTSGDDRQP